MRRPAPTTPPQTRGANDPLVEIGWFGLADLHRLELADPPLTEAVELVADRDSRRPAGSFDSRLDARILERLPPIRRADTSGLEAWVRLPLSSDRARSTDRIDEPDLVEEEPDNAASGDVGVDAK